MACPVEDVFGGIRLDRPAAIHDNRTVGDLGDDPHVVRDEQDGHVLLVLKLLYKLQDLRLDRDVERRGRFVGNEQFRSTGERHGNHDPLNHAAGKLVRIVIEAGLDCWDAHSLQEPQRFGMHLTCRKIAVPSQCLGHLCADGMHRIEARHRFLEDHGDLVAADLAQCLFRHRQQFVAVKPDAPLNTAGPCRIETHHRERRDALSRSRLADERDGFLRGQVERYVVHNLLPSCIGAERNRKVCDGKDRLPHDFSVFLVEGSLNNCPIRGYGRISVHRRQLSKKYAGGQKARRHRATDQAQDHS